MSKKKKRQHVWGGAGYSCLNCGAIKDTRPKREECTGEGYAGYDVWFYHAGAGWWLQDGGLPSLREASEVLRVSIGTGNIVAGAVLPAGNPLGLFTKRMS